MPHTSEPVVDGIERAVHDGRFSLLQEIFFNTPGYYRDFAEFEHRIINATHSDYSLDAKLYQRVNRLFERHMQADGAHFINPQRVVLLLKPDRGG